MSIIPGTVVSFVALKRLQLLVTVEEPMMISWGDRPPVPGRVRMRVCGGGNVGYACIQFPHQKPPKTKTTFTVGVVLPGTVHVPYTVHRKHRNRKQETGNRKQGKPEKEATRTRAAVGANEPDGSRG